VDEEFVFDQRLIDSLHRTLLEFRRFLKRSAKRMRLFKMLVLVGF
jgi:hypothetical protein